MVMFTVHLWWRTETYLGLEGILSQTSDGISNPLLGKLTSSVAEIPEDVLKISVKTPSLRLCCTWS